MLYLFNLQCFLLNLQLKHSCIWSKIGSAEKPPTFDYCSHSFCLDAASLTDVPNPDITGGSPANAADSDN